jgi:hypothetical protein
MEKIGEQVCVHLKALLFTNYSQAILLLQFTYSNKNIQDT